MSADVETVAGGVGKPPPAGPGRGMLAAGTPVANGRYAVGELARRSPFAEVYQASDTANGHPVTLHLLHRELVATAPQAATLRELAELGVRMHHKNVVHVLEVAADRAGAIVVTEHVDGSSLAERLDRKHASGSSAFSPRAACSILTHVCAGLEYAHATTVHGALTPASVIVGSAGRVKITDFGLAWLVPPAARGRLPDLAPYMAPEMLTGVGIDQRADIYAAGALLYLLLTGRVPGPGAPRPSALVPGVPATLDDVIARCTAHAPAQRFPDGAALKEALKDAIADLPQRLSGEAAAVEAPTRPSLAQAIAQPRISEQRESESIDIPFTAPVELISAAALTDTHEKWLLTKGKLDYGPFPLGEVLRQIDSGEILPGNVVTDNETGQRSAIEEHPLFAERVDHAARQRDDHRRAHAEVMHHRQEKRRGRTLYLVLAFVVAGLGGGAYLVVTKLRASGRGDDHGKVSSLEESRLEAKITFPARGDKGSGKKPVRHGGGGGGGGGGGPGWNDALDLGDASEGGGDERLDDTQINPVISAHGGQLGACLRHSGEGSASIEFIIQGSGRVSQVRVNGSTGGALADCVGRTMRAMQFPSFNGARTRAEFEMSL